MIEDFIKLLTENWEISLLTLTLTISILIIIKVVFNISNKTNKNKIEDRNNIRVDSPTVGGDYIVYKNEEK